MIMVFRTGPVLSIAVTIVLCGMVQISCNSSGRDWEAAVAKNDFASYEEFVAKHPQDQRVGEARAKIEALEWNVAHERGTQDAYRSFLTKHGASAFRGDAERAIDDLEWKAADSAATLESYKDYVKRYPNGLHVSEAAARIKTFPTLFEGYFFLHMASNRVFDPNNKFMFMDVTACRAYDFVEPAFADFSMSTEGAYIVRGVLEDTRLRAISVTTAKDDRIRAMQNRCPRGSR